MADVAAAPEKKEDLFGIVAEVDGRQKQLVLLNLSFGRLIDEIVVPYEEDQPFFIDGVPVTKNKIRANQKSSNLVKSSEAVSGKLSAG